MRKSTKRMAKGLAVLMAAGMPLTQMNLQVFAAESPQTIETTQINEETPAVEEVKSYDEVFRIPSTSITSIVNNAGHYGNSTIDKAIDGKNGTHWETNKPNTNTFHNTVTFTFDDVYELSTMNYLVRQDGAKPKGFPLEYILYYSTSETGEDFQILKEGSFKTTNGGLVSLSFQPTSMRRIRMEFVKAHNNWASMAEAQFYQYDQLKDEMEEVFTDHTYTALTSDYQNLAAIEKLEKEAAQHPNKVVYEKLLQDAKTLLKNPDAFMNKTMTVSQRGNVNKETSRTKIWGHMYALDPTGYYVTPGEKLTVYVEADASSVLPQLVFGQVADDKNGWRRAYTLHPGINEITAPGYDNMKPAAIYFSNEALPADQPYAPKVRFEGGTKFPMFVLGESDTATFKKELETYMQNVSFNDEDFANGNPNGYYYNISEITSKNVIISTTASGANKEVNKIVNKGKTVDYYMEAWEDMYYSYAEYSGFDTEDESSANYMPRGKFNSRVFTKGPYGWADYGYTGYDGGNGKQRDGEFFSTLIEAPTTGGWGVYHEWGHVYDAGLLGRGESTNNLYSLLMQDKYRESNRMTYEKRWENHFTNYHNTKNYPNDQLFYGAIVYQLEGVFGHDIYGKASKLARENKDGIMTGLKNNNDRLAVALSFAIGQDVTGHFDYFNQKVSDVAKEKVSALPVNTQKTWYVNDKTFAKDAAAFQNKNAKPVVKVDGSNLSTLQISMEEDANTILNYEVYRDGEYLGVTYSNSFTDKNIEPNTTYTYTVIAYDRKLNASLISDPVTYNPTHPIFQMKTEQNIELYSDFDPLEGVKALNASGEDITSAIKVVKNTVNTNKKGTYEVVYQVKDAADNSFEQRQQVNVVARFDYLSDLNWKSAAVGYKTVVRDGSVDGSKISLYDGYTYPVYQKGLGAHANSKIVYDVAGKGYASFEAYIGVNHRDNINQGSVTFEVWVDGVKKYDSGVMKANAKQKHVQVDLTDAKEVTLITTDAKDGNGYDHSVWADAKFVVLDAKPEISAATIAAMPGEAVDLMKNVSAFDTEDGDLTDKIEVITDYTAGRTGTFDVTYRVADNDENISEKTVKLIIANSSTYLSDLNWKSAQAGWGSVHKDASVAANAIRLRGDAGAITYEKGLGTHAKSTIVYDISGKDYAYFTSYVGVDQEMNRVSSVVFQVYVDGVLKEQTPVMTPTSQQIYINVNIAGAKELKLVVTDANNGNGSDHADWADAKLWTGEHLVNTDQLQATIDQMDQLVETAYTSTSWNVLKVARKAADEAMLSESQDQIDQAEQSMKQALEQLLKAGDPTRLQSLLDLAKQIKTIEDIHMDTHKDGRLYNLRYMENKVEEILDEMEASRDVTPFIIKQYEYMMVYTLEECGYEITI